MKKSQAEGHLFWYLFSRPSNSNKSITIEGKYHLTIAHGYDNQLPDHQTLLFSIVRSTTKTVLARWYHSWRLPRKDFYCVAREPIKLVHTPEQIWEIDGSSISIWRFLQHCTNVRRSCPLTIEQRICTGECRVQTVTMDSQVHMSCLYFDRFWQSQLTYSTTLTLNAFNCPYLIVRLQVEIGPSRSADVRKQISL